MHIGIFTLRDMDLAGGAWLRIVGSAQYLQELGCKVTFFGPSFPSALEGKAEYVRIAGQIGNAEPFRRTLLLQASYEPLLALSRCFPSYRSLARTLNDTRLDLIHCHGHSGGLLLLRALPKLSAPIAFDVHGIYRLQLGETASLRDRLARHFTLRGERRLFTSMAALLIESATEREFFSREYGIDPHKVFALPSGADVDFLCQSVPEEEKNALRKEYGLDGKRIVLFAGAFKPQSGVTDLIRAFGMISSQHPELCLVLIGSQLDMSEEDKSFLKTASLSHVVMAGRQSRERFRAFQQIADVVVVPDIDCAFTRLYPPLKLYDALASGKPAVVTRVPSRAEMIHDGVNGYLVTPQDPTDIGRGIQRALNDPGAPEAGRRGRQLMIENHSWRSSARSFVKAYESILASPRP